MYKIQYILYWSQYQLQCLHSMPILLVQSTNLFNTVLQFTVNLYIHISLLENFTASISWWYNKNVQTAICPFWLHTRETFLPYIVINWQPHYRMSDRRKAAKRSTGKASRNKDQSDDCNTTPTKKWHTADVINNKGKSNAEQTIGISKSNATTCMINHPTVATHINAEIENHTQTNQIVNHSKVGAVADFISVSEKTGNTSSILEEQQVSTISYIPVLFWVKN